MRKLITFIIIASLFIISCVRNDNPELNRKDTDNVLKIYCYDSFASWGLGKAIIAEFEKQNNCTVKLESVGDAGAMLNRMVLEKDRPKCDIAIGIDNTFLQSALDNHLFSSYKPENSSVIDKDNVIDDTWHLTTYDYGYFAFVYDSDVIKNPPKTFGEMQSTEYSSKIILMDPRTSSPGKGLFLWSLAVFGEKGFNSFWKSLKPNILTIPASWDDGYSAFLAGEAPIVLSYSTSPAYHIELEKTSKYKAFIPQEGAFKQIEGAGIVKGCSNPNLAKKFIHYMLTDNFQKHIPTTQWMYPVLNSVALPEGFNACPKPSRIVNDRLKQNYYTEKWINQWLGIMIK